MMPYFGKKKAISCQSSAVSKTEKQKSILHVWLIVES